MFKLWLAGKKHLAQLLLACLCAAASGVGHAIVYTYTDIYGSCDALTVSSAGAITCNCSTAFELNPSDNGTYCPGGTSAFRFRFAKSPLYCDAGLSINMDSYGAQVSCADTLPNCTSLSASSIPVVPGDKVTLQAQCGNGITDYQWEQPFGQQAQQGANSQIELTIPDAAEAGYHTYSVRASNSYGYGSSASVSLKVELPGQSGPYLYIPDASGAVSVLDTASRANAQTITDTEAGTFGVAVHPSGIRVYVTNRDQDTVSVIDTVTNKLIYTVDLQSPSDPAFRGAGPAGVAITPDGKYIYVANTDSQNVLVIDALDDDGIDSIIKPVPLPPGSNPVGVAVASKPDGKVEVFVANSGTKTVSVIDAGTHTLKNDGLPTDEGPHGIAASPDGIKVYVTNSVSNNVTVIDTSTYASSGKYPPGITKPQGIAVKPDGNEVYVVNRGSGTEAGTVSVIGAAGNSLATITGLGVSPYGVSFNSSGSLAYVTNTGGSVSVIDTATRTVVDTIEIGTAPNALGQFVGPASPYRGLWWNPAESGWGMSITQHGHKIFAVSYTYDSTGQPIWYTLDNCQIGTGRSCTSNINRVNGGVSPDSKWNGAGIVESLVGEGTLTFLDDRRGKFTYTIDNVPGSKDIERPHFDNDTSPQFVDYTDLWWNTDESGWGVALTQDMGIIFATWYTYEAGEPVWYTVDECRLSAAATGNSCEGSLKRVSGGAALTAEWGSGAQIKEIPVGVVKFEFTDAGNGTMSYTIDGVNYPTKQIVRYSF